MLWAILSELEEVNVTLKCISGGELLERKEVRTWAKRGQLNRIIILRNNPATEILLMNLSARTKLKNSWLTVCSTTL